MKAATKGETTYQDDFKWPEPETASFEEKREKPSRRIRPTPLYQRFDTHWEVFSENWPRFNFYHRPKDIIATDPRAPFEIKEPSWEDDELIRKTRPRVVMAPALSLDDAAEVLGKNELDLLLAYTYTTTWGKASREAALCIPKKPVLTTTYEPNPDQARFHPEKMDIVECPPFKALQVKVSTEKPEESSSEQRGTEEQSLDRSSSEQRGAEEQSLDRSSSEQRGTEEQSDTTEKSCELRLAHDLPKSGYAGYMPRHVANIPLCKPKYPVTDVRVSVNQAVTMRTGSKEIC